MTLPKPWLLVVSGNARTGKDTVGLWAERELGAVRVALADPVRELTGTLYGLPGDREWWENGKSLVWVFTNTLHGRSTEEERSTGMLRPNDIPNATGTLRDLLIHVGMTLRAIDPDFWLRIACARIEAARAEGKPVVVTDCRFANEAEAFRTLGGFLLRLERDGCPPAGVADLALAEWQPHVTLANNGTIADLETRVCAYVDQWRL